MPKIVTVYGSATHLKLRYLLDLQWACGDNGCENRFEELPQSSFP